MIPPLSLPTITAPGLIPDSKSTNEAKPVSLNLRDWLTYANPERVYLDKLIYPSEPSMLSLGTCFSDGWSQMLHDNEAKEIVDFLKEKLQGLPVVDLGSGTSSSVESLAVELGASDCIQVDRFINERFKLEPLINLRADSRNVKQKETYTALVQADMLDFISRMPDGSANFFINGIDRLIIENRDYHEALTVELTRATPIGGIICGINSEVLRLLSTSSHFKLIRFPSLEERKRKKFDSVPYSFVRDDIEFNIARPMDRGLPCIFVRL